LSYSILLISVSMTFLFFQDKTFNESYCLVDHFVDSEFENVLKTLKCEIIMHEIIEKRRNHLVQRNFFDGAGEN